VPSSAKPIAGLTDGPRSGSAPAWPLLVPANGETVVRGPQAPSTGYIPSDQLANELNVGQSPDSLGSIDLQLVELLFPTAAPGQAIPSPDVSGVQLDEFRLQRRVGIGGMGSVFLAEDERLRRIVALKVLSPWQARADGAVRRFVNEARAAAALDHPHIARVFTYGTDKGFHYIAFEYISGTNLRDVVRQRGRLEASEAVLLTIQIVSALQHTSAAGIVHRDIKPSNILVGPGGFAKLVDLGLARKTAGEESAELTVAGTTLGTFDYISPEQAREPSNVDVRSDIYSLGCTVYHMLTGEPPYPDGTVLQKLLDHQGKDSPDPRKKNPRVPVSLSKILKRMMASEVKRRYQTADELMNDLVTVAHSLGVKNNTIAGPLGRLSVSPGRSHWLRSNVGWLATAAALVLAVVLIDRNPEILRGPAPSSSGSGGSSSISIDQTKAGASATIDKPAGPTTNIDPSTAVALISPQEPGSSKSFSQPIEAASAVARSNGSKPAIGSSEEGSRPSEQATEPRSINKPNERVDGSGGKVTRTPDLAELLSDSGSGFKSPKETLPQTPAPWISGRSLLDFSRYLPFGGDRTKGATTSTEAPATRSATTKPDPIPSATTIGKSGQSGTSIAELTTPKSVIAPSEKPTTSRTKGAGQAPLAVEPSAMITLIGGKSYSSLEAACTEAPDGGVIELKFSGKRVERERPIRLAGKRITIRAAKGYRPVIELTAPDDRLASALTVVNGSLTLINVDLQLRVSEQMLSERVSMIALVRAEKLQLQNVVLTVINPRLIPAIIVDVVSTPGQSLSTMGIMQDGKVVPPTELVLQQSILRGQATALGHRDSQPLRATIDESLIAVSDSFFGLQGTVDNMIDQRQIDLTLYHNTILLGGSLFLIRGTDGYAEGVLPVVASARNNIISCGAGRPLVDLRAAGELVDLRKQFTWKGERNYFDNISVFWNFEAATRPPLNFEGWNAFWQSSEVTGSKNHAVSWRGNWRGLPWHQVDAESAELDAADDFNPPVYNPPQTQGATDGLDAGAILKELPSSN
jgi:eukaryotic-like serine/threonine-protein kinase